ncbi:hypothetical protein QCA50_006328 [Cerrena zonata]|uniref:Uncharacterized protein n=1 Tax=Cerrena zonata TaxID=2478898 RepID=A0AAW0FAU7_9APHY
MVSPIDQEPNFPTNTAFGGWNGVGAGVGGTGMPVNYYDNFEGYHPLAFEGVVAPPPVPPVPVDLDQHIPHSFHVQLVDAFGPPTPPKYTFHQGGLLKAIKKIYIKVLHGLKSMC